MSTYLACCACRVSLLKLEKSDGKLPRAYVTRSQTFDMCKGKGCLGTGHEDPEVEERYSYTLPLTSPLGVVGGQHHAVANLPPEKTRYT